MANDTVPMSALFRACSDILEEYLLPLRYPYLTELGLARLRYTKKDRAALRMDRVIEDVREKMAIAGRYDTFYVGKPWCLVAKRHWFQTRQWFATTDNDVVISFREAQVIPVMQEALLRSQYMIQKQATSPERLMLARAKGLSIEGLAIKPFFAEKWPTLYRPPKNEGRWDQPCDHDFRLCVSGYDWKIDVSGERLNGGYGNPGNGKHSVDWHVLARIQHSWVVWEAVVSGSAFKSDVCLETAMSPRAFMTFLNCGAKDLPYELLKEKALC